MTMCKTKTGTPWKPLDTRAFGKNVRVLMEHYKESILNSRRIATELRSAVLKELKERGKNDIGINVVNGVVLYSFVIRTIEYDGSPAFNPFEDDTPNHRRN